MRAPSASGLYQYVYTYKYCFTRSWNKRRDASSVIRVLLRVTFASVCGSLGVEHLAPTVQKMDNAIHQINLCLVDKCHWFL